MFQKFMAKYYENLKKIADIYVNKFGVDVTA